MDGDKVRESGQPKARGLLSFLRGRREDPAQRPPEPPPEDGPPAEPPPEPAAGQAEVEPPQDGFAAAPEGALSQLWRKWAPGAPPPRFSLGVGEGGAPLSSAAVKRELSALGRALERDARARLAELTALERRGRPEGGGEPSLPAKCAVYVSGDGMAAWCFLLPPVGAGGLELDALGRALTAAHISVGIDSGAIAELFDQKGYFQLRLIARGVPAREGEDGQVVERYPRRLSHHVSADREGRVDYRSQSYVQGIRRGDVICEIHPPLPGTDGLRVDGGAVRAKSVREAKLPMGSNTALSEDGLQLVATMDGHLEYSGGAFQVKPMLEVPGDVDYTTGNIDFRGDVHIRGDVRENFTVRATGTVTVDGLVEAAVVEAGGDIVISNGVLGDNKALLKARGSVWARYLESCVVYSGACTFTDCVMAAQIYSDDRVCVTSGRGIIVGSVVTAAHSVEARIIGSKSGRETAVTLGVLPYVQEERRNNEMDLSQIDKELAELDRQTAYLEERQGIEECGVYLGKARLRRSVLALKRDKLLRRQLELKGMGLDLAQCRLACGTVYPLLKLAIGPQSRVIDQMWTGCTAVYDADREEIRFV